MENMPVVSVGAPDDIGLRKVVINGKTAGKVRCPGELQRLLRRAGVAFGHDIHWLGGDCTVWPDRPWRRRTIGTLMAVGLLVTASVLIKIGKADTLDALTYAGRIEGATFLLLALVEVIAATATLDYWRKRRINYSGAIILFGVSAALGVSLLLLMLQISGRVYSPWLLLWVALVLWSSWALWILVRDRAYKGLLHPRRIAIGAIVSVLLGLSNLAYSQVYVPYVRSPLVESAAEFRAPSLNGEGTKMYLPVHLYVRNSGQIPVYLLGSIYWIEGRSASNLKYKLIDSREFVTPAGRVLNPGEEFTQDVVVKIEKPDKSNYDAVSAQAEVYMVRKDRMTMTADYARSRKEVKILREKGKDQDPPGPSDPYFRYQSEISNSSEILNVTRGRQRVTLWWVRRAGWPYIYVDVAPPGERKTFDSHKLATNQDSIERYGLAEVRGSMAQMPFAELLEKAQDARPAQ
ncbi:MULTISPECIES: hypothetical protein [unclassified Streptomyces]|uniref:hypothetical protein n=2 Tax=Streptomyces TaxID=1883 RepID=UPI002ED625F8|nr:hypothetical protein OIC96_32660 [Streptomyces sp. NBC_00775]